MEPDRRNQISNLYHAALERAPEDRVEFLKKACGGDVVLRQEVESLLGYEALATPFLETPAAVAAAALGSAAGRSQMVGRTLGSYTVVAPLGAGGMGEVYRAGQQARSRCGDQDTACALHGRLRAARGSHARLAYSPRSAIRTSARSTDWKKAMA